MATNSPSLMERLMSASTSSAAEAVYVGLADVAQFKETTSGTSRTGPTVTRLARLAEQGWEKPRGIGEAGVFRGRFARANPEDEADDADGDDAEDHMGVHGGLVFLPKKAADAGAAGKHFHRDNHQPGEAQREAGSR